MPSALETETALIGAWPALEIMREGNWEARFAEGYSGRSNSIQTLDPSDDANAEARILQLADIYRTRGIMPAFKVTPMTGRGVIEALDRLGWALWHESIVMSLALSGDWPQGEGVEILDPASPEWLAHQRALQGYSESQIATVAKIMAQAGPAAAGLTLKDADGVPQAGALAVRNGTFCAFFNVVSNAAARRQGFGRRIMQAALGWAQTRGAATAAIQVQADNAAAVGLYRGLGFSEIYQYHYRRPRETK